VLEEYCISEVLALGVKRDLIQALDQNCQYLQCFFYKHSSLEL